MSPGSQLPAADTEERAGIYTFEEYLQEKGSLAYTATGNSMLPFLRAGKDTVVIRSARGKIKKYDVVLYKKGGRYILHRCVSASPYVFAGDHNTFKEYGITDEMILGVMSYAVRNGRKIRPSNFLYKLYYHLWVDLFPVKTKIFQIKYLNRRVCGKIKRIVHHG